MRRSAAVLSGESSQGAKGSIIPSLNDGSLNCTSIGPVMWSIKSIMFMCATSCPSLRLGCEWERKCWPMCCRVQVWGHLGERDCTPPSGGYLTLAVARDGAGLVLGVAHPRQSLSPWSVVEDGVGHGAPEEEARGQNDEQADAGVALLLLLGEEGIAHGGECGLVILHDDLLAEDGHLHAHGVLVIRVGKGLVLVGHVERLHAWLLR